MDNDLPVPPPLVKASRAGLKIGATDILRDIDLEIGRGEWVLVVGPAGAGKTSLLKLAAGAIAPTSGAIERAGTAALVLHDTPLDDASSARDIVARAMAESAGLLEQFSTGSNLYPSPLRGGEGEGVAQSCKTTRPPTLTLPLKGGGNSAPTRSEYSYEHAEALLCDLGLDAYLKHEPFRLSRGYRKRLEIARAIASGASLLCLDDPFSPMDQAARARTAEALRKAADHRGLSILMVGNDPLDALLNADRIVILSAGPGARVAAVRSPDLTGSETAPQLAATPLYRELYAALRDEGAR